MEVTCGVRQGLAKKELIHFSFVFFKSTLGVKKSTSTFMVYGETGKLPLSKLMNCNILNYRYRVGGLSDDKIVKKVFNELYRLDSLGFHTWISEVKRIERSYPVDIGVSTVESLKQHVKTGVRDAYESFWYENINNVKNNPGLRTYRTINQNLVFQCYLDNISDFRFRKALAQLRCSSHSLEIERARHVRPRAPPVHQRLCNNCCVLEDEIHFLTDCTLFDQERSSLFHSVTLKCPNFITLDSKSKFIYLLTSEDPQIQNWVGKFCFYSFRKRGGAAQ